MSSYVNKILLPDETVLCIAVLHWVIFLRGLAVTAFGGAVGFGAYSLLTLFFGDETARSLAKPVAFVALIIVLIGTSMLFGAYMRQTTTEIVMTNHRLIAKYGVVSRATFEIMANRITGANFDQSLIGRMMGFGTIWIHGAGGEVSPVSMIADPQHFYRAVIGVLERFQPR